MTHRHLWFVKFEPKWKNSSCLIHIYFFISYIFSHVTHVTNEKTVTSIAIHHEGDLFSIIRTKPSCDLIFAKVRALEPHHDISYNHYFYSISVFTRIIASVTVTLWWHQFPVATLGMVQVLKSIDLLTNF